MRNIIITLAVGLAVVVGAALAAQEPQGGLRANVIRTSDTYYQCELTHLARRDILAVGIAGSPDKACAEAEYAHRTNRYRAMRTR